MHTDYKLNRYRPSPDALLNPCSDEVFKALFTNESDESRIALRCFLTAVLHKNVKNIELRPNEPPVLDDSDKAVRFDVSCTFNNGEAADVEMQGVNKYNSFGPRAEYLSARLLNTVFHKGDDWQTIPKVYQISLLNFIFDKDDPAAIGHYRMQKDNGHLLSGIQTVIFLELPKIDALGDVPPETLHSEEKWCKFLVDADNPSKQDYINKLTASDGGIMEAKKTLDKISSDWILWKCELDREIIERDRNSELHYAKEQGLQQGTLQAKREDARNMKNDGLSAAKIAEYTGLSEDEIAGL
jgi:predicted transposase/invertase (TIGR01784 family)